MTQENRKLEKARNDLKQYLKGVAYMLIMCVVMFILGIKERNTILMCVTAIACIYSFSFNWKSFAFAGVGFLLIFIATSSSVLFKVADSNNFIDATTSLGIVFLAYGFYDMSLWLKRLNKSIDKDERL